MQGEDMKTSFVWARRGTALGGSLILLLATTVACSSGSGSSGSGDSGTIKLYGLNSMTGDSAPYGAKSQHGAELYVKELNAAGGLTDDCGKTHKVELSVHDMQDSKAEAVTQVRNAATDDSVLAVVGLTNSIGFAAAEPIAASIKIPIINTGAGVPIKAWNTWAYRVNGTADFFSLGMMKVLVQKMHVTTVGIIFQNDQDAQVAAAEVTRDSAKTLGYDVVAYESYRSSDTDYSAQLQNIKKSGAKWIGVYATTDGASKIVRQIREMGIDAEIFSGFATPVDPHAWDLSQGGMKGAYSWAEADLGGADAPVQKFLKGYKEQFNEDATIYSVYGYVGAAAVLDAAKKACTSTDRNALVKALSTLKYDGLIGTITFKNPPTGQNQSPSLVVTQTTGRGQSKVIGSLN